MDRHAERELTNAELLNVLVDLRTDGGEPIRAQCCRNDLFSAQPLKEQANRLDPAMKVWDVKFLVGSV